MSLGHRRSRFRTAILRHVLGENPGEHRYIVTVPGKGYKFVASVGESSANGNEFVDIAHVDIAHADITLLRSGPSRATSRSKKSAFAAAGVIAATAIAALTFGYSYFNNRRPIDSIAVMPFVNKSGDAELEYLSDGMTETLIGRLSHLPNLHVQARSSVFHYKGKETDIRTIGKELNVRAILIGYVVQHAVPQTRFDPQSPFALKGASQGLKSKSDRSRKKMNCFTAS